jgi:PleD family two-component response regulator
MIPASPLVLVFDRDASTRAWYRAAFLATDYHVAEAADGTEVVDFLSRRLPDLLITELRTDHWDGLTLCLIKRSLAATVDIPTLIVMLDTDPDVEAAVRLVGASELIEKPLAPTAVLPVATRLILATPPARVGRRRSGDGS